MQSVKILHMHIVYLHIESESLLSTFCQDIQSIKVIFRATLLDKREQLEYN